MISVRSCKTRFSSSSSLLVHRSMYSPFERAFRLIVSSLTFRTECKQKQIKLSHFIYQFVSLTSFPSLVSNEHRSSRRLCVSTALYVWEYVVMLGWASSLVELYTLSFAFNAFLFLSLALSLTLLSFLSLIYTQLFVHSPFLHTRKQRSHACIWFKNY